MGEGVTSTGADAGTTRYSASGMRRRHVKTVSAVLVTDTDRQPAVLSPGDESSGGVPMLIVEGVAYAPEDLPAGAYLIMRGSEMADQAALAGFVLAPPHAVKRRAFRILGKLFGVTLLVCAVGSILWAVLDVLALDLLGALAWVGLSLFLGLLGLFWWSYGEQYMLAEDSGNQVKAKRLRRRIGSFVRRR